MADDRELGGAWQASRRAELYAVHREWHGGSFAADGSWIGALPRDPRGDAREWLWHALAFLEGDADDVARGNALAAFAPNVPNHFNPMAAALLLLRHGKRLEDGTRRHLAAILRDNHAEAVDFAFAVNSVNNFSAMWAFYHLATSQLLETYEPAYPHRSIPEVYNKFRMRQFGVNVLRLMEAQLARTDLASEFNSPTYSPIALMHLAEIVNLIEHEPAREIAARLESRLWRELLGFHHPLLHHVSGPHSRAYTVDTVGHASGWKVLCCFLGLDGETTVRDLLYPPREGQVIHGCLAHQQCFAVWLARAEYHVAADLSQAFRTRAFPYRFQGTHEWPGKGYRRSDGKIILNVDGDDGFRAGQGTACCYQDDAFSVGSMTRSYTVMNRPCHVVYRLRQTDAALGDTRSASLLMLTRRLPDGQPSPAGMQVPPVSIPNTGDFRIEQDGPCVAGTVRPQAWAPHYGDRKGCDEIGLNLLIGEHLPPDAPVASVRLDELPFLGSAVERVSKAATFVIEDGAVRIAWTVESEAAITFRVLRQAGFLRCAAICYQGEHAMFSPCELEPFCLRFRVQVEKR